VSRIICSQGWNTRIRRGAVAACFLLSMLTPAAIWARGPEAAGGDKLYAIPPRNVFRQNVGLLDLLVTNLGVVGNPFGGDAMGAAWRGSEYLYAGAMWIGAVASDNLAYVSTGAYDYELRPSQDPIDTIYPSYEGVVNGNRPGFSSQPDDDRDGLVDEDPLNGRDDDGDGSIDEDYAAISQQMLSCEYWDYTDEARAQYAEHRPLNVRIRQESYAWSSEGTNEFVGFDYKVINDGFETLRRVYLGFFVDSDVGPKENPNRHVDDGGAYYATDTTFVDQTNTYQCNQAVGGELKKCSEQKLHLNICYMYDHPDNGQSATGGDPNPQGYFGGMFLGHTTDPSGESAPRQVTVHTARFFSRSGAYPAGDPRNDTERYDLLQSGATPLRPTGSPDDYRYIFAAGPFAELSPGEELNLQVAFVIGVGKRGMLANAVNAQRVFNGSWRNVDNDALGRTGIEGRETCLRALVQGEPLTWRDPCDSLNPTVLNVKETICLPENYKDNDCDCCTPLFRNPGEAAGAGLETLVHWVGDVAPPSPRTNLRFRRVAIAPEGDRSVTVAWDNLSELSASPISGVITFSGYQVWRVQGWNRPSGSPGPAPEDWELIAKLARQPEDGLEEQSPYWIGNYRIDGLDTLEMVPTGSLDPAEALLPLYPIGRYVYRDTLGLKNGMVYFYDVTAYSVTVNATTGNNSVFAGRPTAVEAEAAVPRWRPKPVGDLGGIYVVPNPYIRGENPPGWDLTPSDADPTGTKIAFIGLPNEKCSVKIYTLSGDLVQTLGNEGSGSQSRNGAVFWNMVTRNGQDVVSGVYLYLVECGGKSKVGRFVVVR
jgi:hypothetical protein